MKNRGGTSFKSILHPQSLYPNGFSVLKYLIINISRLHKLIKCIKAILTDHSSVGVDTPALWHCYYDSWCLRIFYWLFYHFSGSNPVNMIFQCMICIVKGYNYCSITTTPLQIKHRNDNRTLKILWQLMSVIPDFAKTDTDINWH